MWESDVVWCRAEAVELCMRVEDVCTRAGCHVALTGGCLYKAGFRKDCDLLFYRIRQVPAINLEILWKELETIGLKKISGHNWVYKGTFRKRGVDMFFPEEKAVCTNNGDIALPLKIINTLRY